MPTVAQAAWIIDAAWAELSVGTRPDVHGRAFAAHAHWLLGHAEEALQSRNDAIALARTTDNS